MRTSCCTAIINLLLVLLMGSIGCEERTLHSNYGAPQDMVIDANFKADFLNVQYYALRTCFKCHDNRIPPNLGSYKDLTANMSEVLEEVSVGEMPPSADGYEPLNSCQLLVLNKWVSSGMPKRDGPTLGAPGNACY